MISEAIRRNVCLRPFTTLQAGGSAELFVECYSAEELIQAAEYAQERYIPTTVLGWGSNVLPSDNGVEGLVILNLATKISVALTGEIVVETGAGLQDVFLKTAQAGLHGLSFAVGIPGSVGGALVSNAGAYRSCIGEFVVEIEVTTAGATAWRDKSWMQFSYRDSVFRDRGLQAVMSRVHLKLPQGSRKQIYDEAREYQRQRIGKQPPSPSAGSFFKNIVDPQLANHIPGLTEGMKANGVIPAGFLIEACGLKGFRIGGAMLGMRHANFVLNVGRATASEIRAIAEWAKASVMDRFGVRLEEEVLYLGKWAQP